MWPRPCCWEPTRREQPSSTRESVLGIRNAPLGGEVTTPKGHVPHGHTARAFATSAPGGRGAARRLLSPGPRANAGPRVCVAGSLVEDEWGLVAGGPSALASRLGESAPFPTGVKEVMAIFGAAPDASTSGARSPTPTMDGTRGSSMRNAWSLVALVVTGVILTAVLDAARLRSGRLWTPVVPENPRLLTDLTCARLACMVDRVTSPAPAPYG
jgi:hypothetical protein